MGNILYLTEAQFSQQFQYGVVNTTGKVWVAMGAKVSLLGLSKLWLERNGTKPLIF